MGCDRDSALPKMPLACGVSLAFMKNCLEDLLLNSNQRDFWKDMGTPTFGGRTLAKLVRLSQSDAARNGHSSTRITTHIIAIIHVIAVMTVFGYAWRYHFQIRKYLKSQIWN